MALSGDGSLLSTSSIERLALWDRDGNLRKGMEEGCCYQAAFNPPSTHLAAAFYDKHVSVFDVGNLTAIRRLATPGPVSQTLWLSDERLLIRSRLRSNGPHRTMLWDALTDQCVLLDEDHLSEGPATATLAAGLLIRSTDAELRCCEITLLFRHFETGT